MLRPILRTRILIARLAGRQKIASKKRPRGSTKRWRTRPPRIPPDDDSPKDTHGDETISGETIRQPRMQICDHILNL